MVAQVLSDHRPSLTMLLVSALLTAREKFFSWHRGLRKAKQSEVLRALDKLQNEVTSDIEIGFRGEKLARLEGALRKYPYWWFGHMEVVPVALDSKCNDLAFASAQAALKLAASARQSALARHYLAKTYLAAHRFRDAEELLIDLRASDYCSRDMKEDLAACYIAKSEPREAYEVLASVPAFERTDSIKLALCYLEQQTSKLSEV